MKSDVMGIGAQISKKELKDLTKETKETLAIDVTTDGSKKVFGAIDLWNLQKRQRTSTSMRRWLN
jgi:hypothetical protein